MVSHWDFNFHFLQEVQRWEIIHSNAIDTLQNQINFTSQVPSQRRSQEIVKSTITHFSEHQKIAKALGYCLCCRLNSCFLNGSFQEVNIITCHGKGKYISEKSQTFLLSQKTKTFSINPNASTWLYTIYSQGRV